MVSYLKQLEAQAGQWPGVSAGTHRFGGRVFRLGRSEIGHVHSDGAVEMPFPGALRNELVAQGLAEQHRTAPDSGWITFHVRRDVDVQHAVWLLRISYLRFVLKAVPDPGKRFDQESDRLRLNSRLKALLRRFLPAGKEIAA